MSQYSHQNNATVADIYKSVITDVINQVKEAFLDENVDVDVLQQLKKDWEDKVNTSGCVELEPRNMIQHQIPPPNMRQGPMQGRPMQIPVARMPTGNSQLMHHPVGIPMDQGQTRQVQVPMHFMQQGIPQGIPIQGQHVQAVLQGQNVQPINVQGGQPVFPQGVRIVQSNFMQGQQPMMIMQNANGQPIQQLPFQLGPNVQMGQIRVQQQHMQQHHQLDGNGNREDEEDEVQDNPDQPGSSKNLLKASKSKISRQPSRKHAEEVLAKLLHTIQLDGGGGRMSDSSSEEEEEENDPLRRIADKIGGDGAIDEGDNIVEEEPLNSDDDDQDDEELDTIFDADHIIMCLFEKVHRARNKWKFQLKDGVMNINNRDYCFQKCTGDAEW